MDKTNRAVKISRKMTEVEALLARGGLLDETRRLLTEEHDRLSEEFQ